MPEAVSVSQATAITNPTDQIEALSSQQLAILQVSVLVVALCGIIYELIIATVSSYLLGDSVFQFSVTIGLFMFAMGIGSYLSKQIYRDLVANFVLIEIVISLFGGLSSSLLFVIFPYQAFYQPVMYVLILIIGTLVGLEIPILTRILSQSHSLRNSIAQVLSLDYLGGLIGSLAFPLLLLPFLGLFRSSFCIGLLNVCVALLNVLVFSSVLKRPRLALGLTIAGAVLLTAGMLYASVLSAYAEGQLFRHHIIHREQTPYQRLVITRNEVNGKIRLFIDGHLQFAEMDEYRYHEALVHPIMSAIGPRAHILVLGGGDGLAVREILKYSDVSQIDLVDIDPAMTTLGQTFAPLKRLNRGSLDNKKVRIHNLDAFIFVRNAPADFYDRIIIDLPDPHNEALTKLYSVEFYKMLRYCLSPNGYVVTQSSSPFFTREVFWSIAATLQAAGMETYSYQILMVSFGVWGFTLAAADGPAPDTFQIIDNTRFLDDQLMVQAGTFGKDTGPLETPTVNSLFEPKMHHLYRLGMRR